jgi:hypothetical protein
MSFSSRWPFALALVVLSFAAVGCDEVIDGDKTEATVQHSLETSLHEKIKSVDCPSEPKIDPGTTFTCTVVFPKDKQATVTLKIRNKDADLSIVGFKPKK